MKIFTTISIFILLLISCRQDNDAQIEFDITAESTEEYRVLSYSYDSMTIPSFFRELVANHLTDCLQIDSDVFNNFCVYHDLNNKDSSIKSIFFTFQILHSLFTSQYASDCSKGSIVNMPYYWHWISPNPRHEIYFVESNKLLVDTKPPKEFSNYNSYADIDRTPYLFLSDLMADEPKYYSIQCDTFSTFGWCSEREMAFVSLLSLLGFEGKAIAENNHSWSEFIVPLTSLQKESIHFKVKVDNTFDGIVWEGIDSIDLVAWKNYKAINKQANWYNQKAHDELELIKIKNHLVSSKAMERIDNKLAAYYTVCINENE